LLQVNNVNIVSRPENIGLHFGVPLVGLVAEVDTCLKQHFHGNS
jgi:hypothetical protein